MQYTIQKNKFAVFFLFMAMTFCTAMTLTWAWGTFEYSREISLKVILSLIAGGVIPSIYIIYSVGWLIGNKPLLKANDTGIYISVSPLKEYLVLWSQIVDFSVFDHGLMIKSLAMIVSRDDGRHIRKRIGTNITLDGDLILLHKELNSMLSEIRSDDPKPLCIPQDSVSRRGMSSPVQGAEGERLQFGTCADARLKTTPGNQQHNATIKRNEFQLEKHKGGRIILLLILSVILTIISWAICWFYITAGFRPSLSPIVMFGAAIISPAYILGSIFWLLDDSPCIHATMRGINTCPSILSRKYYKWDQILDFEIIDRGRKGKTIIAHMINDYPWISHRKILPSSLIDEDIDFVFHKLNTILAYLRDESSQHMHPNPGRLDSSGKRRITPRSLKR